MRNFVLPIAVTVALLVMPSRAMDVVLPQAMDVVQTDARREGASRAQEMQLQRLSEHVFAVVQPAAQRFDDSNSLLIVTTEGVVVVDAQAQPANVRRVMALADQVSELPVVMVINTHWHPDHTQGNALYRQRYGDAVTIVGHDLLFEDLPGRAAPMLARQVEEASARLATLSANLAAIRKGDALAIAPAEYAARHGEATRLQAWLAAHRDARFLPPTLSYDDFMRLQIGDVRIHLIHFRAHTGGDTVVWLPQHKIMATGDVLDDLPYVGDGSPSSWINALHDIDMMNPRLIVPGHGPVLRDERQLDNVRSFLEALCREVGRARARGLTLDEAQQSLRFEGDRTRLSAGKPHARRLFDEALADAIASAWREADSTP